MNQQIQAGRQQSAAQPPAARPPAAHQLQPPQQQQQPEGRLGMLLCRVVLGRVAQGTGGLRRPPTGSDSVTQMVCGAAHADPDPC